MKKIIILFAIIIASFSANAQKAQRFEDGIYSKNAETRHNKVSEEITVDDFGDIVIGTVTIHITEYAYGGGFSGCIFDGGDGEIAFVKVKLKKNLEKIDIPECNHEAFKTANGAWIIMNKELNRGYSGEIFDKTVFRLYTEEALFRFEIKKLAGEYQQEVRRKEERRRALEEKKEMVGRFF